jgi:8-oxo-dGTP diphosphatase
VTIERAGVIVVRGDRLALIERTRHGRKYWVIPGGGVEQGETVQETARREAEEELGVPVELGALRVCIDHREEDGSIQRQWYFEATVGTDDVRVVGPENIIVNRGTHCAVWIRLDELDTGAIHPTAVAHFIARNHGEWPNSVINIDEQ